jgi:hypothetical protein
LKAPVNFRRTTTGLGNHGMQGFDVISQLTLLYAASWNLQNRHTRPKVHTWMENCCSKCVKMQGKETKIPSFQITRIFASALVFDSLMAF